MTSSNARPTGDVSERLAPLIGAVQRGERDSAMGMLDDRSLSPADQAELRVALAESFEMAGRFDEGLQVLSRYEDTSMHDGLAPDLVAQIWLQLASLYRWL